MPRLHFRSRKSGRKGSVVVVVAVAMTMLMTAAALVVDLGQIVVAADVAQRTADAAALAGAAETMAGAHTAATTRVVGVVVANSSVSNYPQSAPSQDLVFYAAGQAVPGFRTLGTNEEAIKVAVEAEVEFSFARVLGLYATTVVRSATAARVHIARAPIVPMFVIASTSLAYGQLQELHASTADPASLPPGSFGWSAPLSGDFSDLLRGYQVPQATLDANTVGIGDALTALTGEKTGQWVSQLADRLARASVPPYSTQTPTDGGYSEDNPRILLVPLVQYAGMSGSNATYDVVSFGAFWLEAVSGGNDKTISGRFLHYEVPATDDTPTDTGLLTVRLVN